MKEIIPCLFSGGAAGADTVFTQAALSAGHDVINFHFNKSLNIYNCYYLEQDQLNIADSWLHRANETLKRVFPTKSTYVNNLLRRNFYQIYTTTKVYAVSRIENGLVTGGTAWAVQMAIDKGNVEVYVYDMTLDRWVFWENGNWSPLDGKPPKPTGSYTGIGSRDLTEAGIKAIESLYV